METHNELKDALLTVNEAGKISKLTMETHADTIIRKVMDGELEPWKAIAYCRYIADLAKTVREGVMPTAIAQFTEPFSYEGISLKVKEAGTKYDYESSNHPEYNKLAQQVRELEMQMKDLQKMLAAMKKPMDIVDKESGEVITVYPPKKTSTTVVEVSYNTKILK